MGMHTTVLLTGCHQPYGRALARMLANLPDLQLWITGEKPGDCIALCADVRADIPNCHIHPLDTDQQTPSQLIAASGATLVVHANAPFTRHCYDMAQACIDAGVSYIDVAERRSFIASFTGALHHQAKRAGVSAITGAAMTPAMTSAIIEDLAPAFHHLEDVRVTLIPGIRSLQPGSQMATMLSTIGRPMDMLYQGQRVKAISGRSIRTVTLPSLGRCSSVLCDLPDNETIPPSYPHLQTLETRMGLPGRLAPRAVWLLSSVRQTERRRKQRQAISSPQGRAQQRFSDRAVKNSRLLPWLAKRLANAPAHHGAVLVEANGSDLYGRPLQRSCRVEASAAEAPYFPLLPAVALVRQMMNEPATVPVGAQPCLGIVSLKAILAEMCALTALLERRQQRLALPCPDAAAPRPSPAMGTTVKPAPV